MNWFYAKDGQQAGPVDDVEFERLVREGAIQPATLVWREGMEKWEPLANVAPTLRPFSSAPVANASDAPNRIVCAECGKLFSAEETVQIGAATICAACKPGYVQKLREGAVRFTPASAVTGMRYAGFWIRAGARVIDEVIMTILTLPFSFIFGFQFSFNPGTMPDLMKILAQQGIIMLLGIFARMLYAWLFVGRYAATPGKLLVGIRIVTAEGQRISYGRSFGRFWADIVSQFTCYIGYILAAFDDEKRTLHDRICNTRVVYK